MFGISHIIISFQPRGRNCISMVSPAGVMVKPFISSVPLSFLKKKKTFIYLKGRIMKREIHTERKIFHPLIHSPNRHIKQGWVKPKPGAQNSIHVSHADGRGPSTSVFHYFPRRFSRECIRSGAARAQTSPLIQDSGAASDGLIH